MPRSDNLIETDGALILGAGIAGLFTALKLAPFPAVVLANSRPGYSGSSAWAQGGIAAALAPDDDWRNHARDTVAAGAGLCDPEIVRRVTRDGPARIADLVALGVNFDRDPSGFLALGREAAHSRARIVHVTGDRAGAEISRVLAQRAFQTPSIRILEGFHAVEVATEGGRAIGLFVRHGLGADARLLLIRGRALIFATGGLGALYAVTTNPACARGEGLGMAARAGAAVADAEFVQFHPTALAVGRDPAPLATEALRGEGAILVDETGRRFMTAAHADAELAPRDIVARAIHRELARGKHVFLDCRHAIGSRFARRFPTVHAAALAAGIDPARAPIPVAPAAHYHMGGILCDSDGKSSLPGLCAVGECAATGLHGANRLASNSLLEALVFAARVAENVRDTAAPGKTAGEPPAPQAFGLSPPPHVLRAAMTRHVGLERNGAGLRQALGIIARLEQSSIGNPALLNMLAAARLVATGALLREESRGAHWRTDHPSPQTPATRSFLTLTQALSMQDAPPSRSATSISGCL
ncbi:MAG: L-aspartate oxidase [Rhizomicrobium sp.]